MNIHPVPADGLTSSPTQERPDTASTYDSTWTEQPETETPDGLERVMLADGKIYVVLAVVLLIWFGLLAVLIRTDRKINRLERRLDEDGSYEDEG